MKRALTTSIARVPCIRTLQTTTRAATATPKAESSTQPPQNKQESAKDSSTPKKKTSAELDRELREKLEGMSGDGGGAGVEYENGRAEGLKRGVKSNMFRVI
ncbi:Ff.00g036790.m01.CDS01 [Fusarium sp. VM40]|nr:Ff.00g036790.m01.CDS01 [Fusarium sp. VM40]